MTRLFILATLTTLSRALLAHCCGEVIQIILRYSVPGMPPIVCVAIALVLAAIIVEIATILWHRHNTTED
jgi:hypothetical protein